MTIDNNYLNLNTNYFDNWQTNWFSPTFSSFSFPTFDTSWLPEFDFSNLFSDSNLSSNLNFFSSKTFSCNIFSNNIFDSCFQSSFNNTFNTFDWGDSFNRTTTGGKSSLKSIANKALSYVGKVNSDLEGNRLFSGGVSRPWCADFVTYVAKQTLGSKLPSSFGSSAVADLKSWGESNNCYLKVPSSNKKSFIAQNVKVGDIMIEKNGKSHTGIVTEIYSDGSFDVVEGNSGNKVSKVHYTADSSTLSGFVSLSKYA